MDPDRYPSSSQETARATITAYARFASVSKRFTNYNLSGAASSSFGRTHSHCPNYVSLLPPCFPPKKERGSSKPSTPPSGGFGPRSTPTPTASKETFLQLWKVGTVQHMASRVPEPFKTNRFIVLTSASSAHGFPARSCRMDEKYVPSAPRTRQDPGLPIPRPRYRCCPPRSR